MICSQISISIQPLYSEEAEKSASVFYYFDYWGFDAPDIFILQWGYNEVKSYEGVNSESVQTSKLRAKRIIDKFHSQYPNTKFVFGLEFYGAELMTFLGGSYRNALVNQESGTSVSAGMVGELLADMRHSSQFLQRSVGVGIAA